MKGVPISILVIAFLAAGLAGCGSGPGTVKGTVTQAKDASLSLDDRGNIGPALPGAEIKAYALSQVEGSGEGFFNQSTEVGSATTDERGEFSLTLEPGTYQIKVRVNGTEVRSSMVEIKNGRTVSVRLNVPPQP